MTNSRARNAPGLRFGTAPAKLGGAQVKCLALLYFSSDQINAIVDGGCSGTQTLSATGFGRLDSQPEASQFGLIVLECSAALDLDHEAWRQARKDSDARSPFHLPPCCVVCPR